MKWHSIDFLACACMGYALSQARVARQVGRLAKLVESIFAVCSQHLPLIQ